MALRKIEISPLTRLEGHGKVAIFLDQQGNVADAFFQVTELRGYEQLLTGIPIEEVPRIVSTVCGVCRCVHFTAALKAADAVYNVIPTPTARKIRELVLNAHFVEDHAAVLYALGLPDFVVGLSADPAERNLVGLLRAIGAETGRTVLKKRYAAVQVIEMLAGKPVHPVAAVPGGWSKQVTEEERREILARAKEMVELGRLTLKVFEANVLRNKEYTDLVRDDVYKVVCNYMGTVDEKNRVQFYEGTQRVVNPEGKEIVRFTGVEYLDHLAERVLPWSYAKLPFLKTIGWKGINDGRGTSLYCVGPLARFNVANGLDTPLAQEAYEKMYDVLGAKPVHNILAYHWARVIELLHAAEKVQQLASDESITGADIFTTLEKPAAEGVGIIEACRGTLIHHYRTDDQGIVEEANLVVATTHNKGPLNVAVKRAAQRFIKDGKVDQGVLNLIEMAHRSYDPCLACATHLLPGRLPIHVEVYDHTGELYKSLRNY